MQTADSTRITTGTGTRMVDALMVTVSRHVIRVENTVTTSNLEALEVDLNDTRGVAKIRRKLR